MPRRRPPVYGRGRHECVDCVVDVGAVDERGATIDEHESTSLARCAMRPTSWVSPGPHTKCGRTATTSKPDARDRKASSSAIALLRA